MRSWVSTVALLAVVGALCALPAPAVSAKKSKASTNGTLAIETMTAGAEVFIDGKLSGTLPIKPLSLKPGSYRLTVRKLGHLEYNNTIKVTAGQETSLMVDLLPVSVVVGAASNAKGAELFVNGANKGALPRKVELKSGTYQVEIRAPGYLPFKQKLTLQDLGAEVPLNATLTADKLAVAAADDPLALEPLALASPAGKGKDAGKGKAKVTAPVDDDPLALEAIAPVGAPSAKSTTKATKLPDDDPLAIEPLALEPVAPPPGRQTLLAAPAGVRDPAVTPTPGGLAVERAWGQGPEWWNEWWVWSIAAAVVVAGGVTAGVVASMGGNEDPMLAGKVYYDYSLEGGGGPTLHQ